MGGFSITTEPKIQNKSVRISMSGNFVFEVHADFTDAYMPLLKNPSIHDIELEVSKVTFVDMAGLAMLLLLHERATVANKSITLLNVCGDMLRKLEFAYLHEVLSIKK